MSEFRSEELISLADLFSILIVTAILLFVAWLFLKKIRPGILQKLEKQFSQKIELIEKRHIPYLGQVFVISVNKEQFVVIQAKTGVAISSLQRVVVNDAEQDVKSLG